MVKKKQKLKGVTSRKVNGSVYWYARTGKKNPEYCGEGEEGKAEAIATRQKYLSDKEVNRLIGKGLAPPRPREYEINTFKELANWYIGLPNIARLASFERKTVAAAHLVNYFGDKALSDGIENADQQHYRKHRKREGVQDGTVNYEIQVLSAMFHEAHKNKKIDRDWMPGAFDRMNKKHYEKKRPMIEECQFEAMLNHCQDLVFRDMMIIAWETAMRQQEIARMTPNQVNLPDIGTGFIHIPKLDTKTSRERDVPVSEWAREVLVRNMKGKAPDELLFPRPDGGRYLRRDFTKRMMKTCADAKVPYGDTTLNAKGERIGIVFHCFRITRTTKWMEAGYSDELIRMATGHDSLEAFRGYLRLKKESVAVLVRDQKKNGTKTVQSFFQPSESDSPKTAIL